MTYIAYLDEFGHVGPYLSRNDTRHNDSPVFGLAGFIMPIEQVRGFGTWFFQRKCELLDFEIKRAGEHPAVWERRQLVEPPFQLESHRYQTAQAADWISGLMGRLGAVWKEPEAWPEYDVFRRYFEHRLTQIQVRSQVRG